MISKKTYFTLFLYHTLFSVISYFYILKYNGDACHYWERKQNIDYSSWKSFLNVGTDFVVLINYPFVKFGVPFFVGFLIYSIIGFIGILNFIKFSNFIFKDGFYIKKFNVLNLIFFLPNLHFWTSLIGKEVLMFYGLSSIFYCIVSYKLKSFHSVFSLLLIILIRPHVALILISSISIILLITSNYSVKKKIVILSLISGINIILLKLVFQLTKIYYFDIDRISYFNRFSILSFKNSGSYVPMLDYNYFYKLFSFNFRPLFFDANSIFSYMASAENCIILFIHIIFAYYVTINYKKISFPIWAKIIFLYVLISSVIFVERYANLGIFMRTKIMFQPFMIIALLYIINQNINSKVNE